MSGLRLSTISLALLFTGACSPGKPPATPAGPGHSPPDPTVFDPLVRQENRAREVQGTVDGHAAEQRAAVEAEERGDQAADPKSRGAPPGPADRGDAPP